MKRRPNLYITGACLALVAALAAGQAALERPALAQSRGGAQAPNFEVERMWPKPLPNHWILGSVTGVAIDSRDHIWIVHNGAISLTTRTEMGTGSNPPTSERCCSAAPPILEFDPAGTLVSNWGGPGDGYQWPRCVQGLGVDTKGNIWVAGNAGETQPGGNRACTAGVAGSTTDPDAPTAAGRGGAAAGAAGAAGRGGAAGAAGAAGGRGGAPTPPALADAQVLKFSSAGKFLRQIGAPGKIEGAESTTTLNRPANIEVDAAANEVYVADTGNRRVVVFDAETGAYKRHWGAYGNKPDTSDLGLYDPNAPPSQQFRSVSCVRIAKDGMVYVCDRTGNRIQVFQKNGKFVKEVFVSKTTKGRADGGSVWDIAFSKDPQQQYMYVADGWDKKVFVLQRSTLNIVTNFGQGGRLPGEFVGVGSLAVDSKGNLYTGETFEGKRIQKWTFKGMAAVSTQNR